MSEVKDPAIKLFGKTIQLPEAAAGVDGGVSEGDSSTSPSSSLEDTCKGAGEDRESDGDKKDELDEKSIDKEEERNQSTISEEITDQNAKLNKNPKTVSTENESATAKTSKSEEEQSEKTLKKPDKILPCPRCNSMDTKFCYYNNYNVNQPRHFCKNCQRYWTAGGTMRNVPVGAGRRKNKSSAAQYRQITVTEALPNELNHSVLKPNGTVLTFGSDAPLCESMASVLQIADKTMMQDGFRKPEELRIPVPVPLNDDDNVKNRSSANEMQNCHGFSPQVPCFPGAPWAYPWPCFPGAPWPYPAAPYWGCPVPVPVLGPGPIPSPGPGPVPGPWNVQWVHPPSAFPFPGPVSPTLGKHSRDETPVKLPDGAEEEPMKENEPEKSLWIPKTLRIDDPDEAAKSSIWATLGIKNDGSVGVNGGGGMFKAFQSKSHEKKAMKEALEANPAALSRSLNFQETS